MIKLKFRYRTDFDGFLSSTFRDVQEKPRKMAHGLKKKKKSIRIEIEIWPFIHNCHIFVYKAFTISKNLEFFLRPLKKCKNPKNSSNFNNIGSNEGWTFFFLLQNRPKCR